MNAVHARMNPRAPSRATAALRLLLVALLSIFALAPARTAHAQTASTAPHDTTTTPTDAHAAGDMLDHGGRALTVPTVPSAYRQQTVGALRVSYPPALEGRFRQAIDNVGRDAQLLATQLGLESVPPLEIRLVPDPDAMRALAPVEAPPPAYASGVAYPSLGLTLVSAMAPRTWQATDVRRTLRHELSHLLLEHATAHAAIPRWFSEGVAVHQASEQSFERFRTLALASFTGGLLPLRELDRGFGGSQDQVDAAYAQSADFIAFLLRAFGEPRFAVLLQQLRGGASLDDAMRQTYRRGIAEVEIDWRDDVKGRFLTAPLWAGSGALWLLASVLLAIAWARRKQRSRETLARWADEESARARSVPVFRLLQGGATHPAPRDDVMDLRGFVLPASAVVGVATTDAADSAPRTDATEGAKRDTLDVAEAKPQPRLVVLQGGRNMLN